MTTEQQISDDDLRKQREEIRRGLTRANLFAALLLFLVFGLGTTAMVAAWRAERAERELERELWNSYLSQARATRLSAQAGSRRESLRALAAASRIQASPTLRNEALATLALPDFEATGALWPFATNLTSYALDAAFDHLALGFEDGAIEICRVRDRQKIARIPPLPTEATNVPLPVTQIYLSPDGERVAAIYNKKDLRIWDRKTASVVYRAALDRTSLSSGLFQFSVDGRRVLFVESDQLVQLVDLTGVEPKRQRRLSTTSYALSLNPRRTVAAISLRSELELWNWASNRTERLSLPAFVRALDWSPDGEQLAIGCDTGEIHLWNATTRRLRVLSGHSDQVLTVAFDATGDRLVTSGKDGVTRLWSVPDGQVLISTRAGQSVGFSQDGRTVAFTQRDAGIGFWQVVDGTGLRTFRTQAQEFPFVRELDLSQDGRFMITLTDAGLQLWNLETNQVPVFLPITDAYSVFFVPGTTSIVATAYSGVLFVPILRTDEAGPAVFGRSELANAPPGHRFTQADLRNDGNVIGVRSTGLTLLLDVVTKQVTRTFAGKSGLGNIAISADGKWVASAPRFDNEITIWDATNGEIKHRILEADASVTFSPDSQWLAVGARGGYRFLKTGTWNTEREIARVTPADFAPPVAFSHDGKLAALCRDGQVPELVDVATGKFVAALTAPHLRSVRVLRFSRDDRHLAVGTGSSVVQLWNLKALRSELAALGLDWGYAGNISLLGHSSQAGAKLPRMVILGASLGVGLVALLALLTVQRHRRLVASYVHLDQVAGHRAEQLVTAQLELFQSQKLRALGTLAAGIAHDFNNLLSVIRMANKLTGEQTRENADLQENVRLVEKTVAQGKGVVHSMLGYSRKPGERGQYSVTAVVEETIKMLHKQFLSGIALDMSLAPDLPEVEGVRNRLEQILLNLMVNAAEAMGGQGKLRIATSVVPEPNDSQLALRPRAAPRFIQIILADSGPGMAPEIRERIFEPFFTTKTIGNARGTGLGLSMVYTIAQEEGLGLILATAPGEGTTFHILVPVVA